MAFRLRNTYTALVSPFSGPALDVGTLERLAQYQVQNGCGLLANGTTAETPALTNAEQHQTASIVLAQDADALVGTGGNCTETVLEKTAHAASLGARGCLLVDCYYNGPSSAELRSEYYAPVLSANPEIGFIPYVIPGRTGCELLVEDLAELVSQHSNLVAVKEATGNLQRMARTRTLAPRLPIFSGDDDLTLTMMSHPSIRAAGVISVMSNLLPNGVSAMVAAHHAGDLERAERLNAALSPLFGMVGVKTTEQTRFGPVLQKWRNPLPVKTAMAALGMIPSGCRQPLGRMSLNGVEAVRTAVRQSYALAPELFDPMQTAFGIDVQDRLQASWAHLSSAGKAQVLA